jgi:para-nitrobenzyl esterase
VGPAARGDAPAATLAARRLAPALPQYEASSDRLALLRPDLAIVAGFRKLQIGHLLRVHFSGGAVR